MAIVGELPAAIAIIVVSRDLMILAAVLIAWLLDNPVAIRPVWVSKFNTVAQIALAALVLGVKALDLPPLPGQEFAVWVVGASTIASGAVYVAQWLEHMSKGEAA
jgi:cardiolipin synthase